MPFIRENRALNLAINNNRNPILVKVGNHNRNLLARFQHFTIGGQKPIQFA